MTSALLLLALAPLGGPASSDFQTLLVASVARTGALPRSTVDIALVDGLGRRRDARLVRDGERASFVTPRRRPRFAVYRSEDRLVALDFTTRSLFEVPLAGIEANPTGARLDAALKGAFFVDPPRPLAVRRDDETKRDGEIFRRIEAKVLAPRTQDLAGATYTARLEIARAGEWLARADVLIATETGFHLSTTYRAAPTIAPDARFAPAPETIRGWTRTETFPNIVLQ